METVATGAIAPKTSRLMIEKLRMENFKSYFGVQEVGIFHQVRILLAIRFARLAH